MPLYEYECPQCQEKFEETKPMSERHDAKCPKCGTRSNLLPSVMSSSFGWRLMDACHERFGPRDEYEKDV